MTESSNTEVQNPARPIATTASAPEKTNGKNGNAPNGLTPRIRLIIFAALLLAAAIWGGTKLYHSFFHVETDNAQIEGSIYPVIPRVAGKVLEVTVRDNQTVSKEQLLIRIDPADYEVKRDMAAAALLTAQAGLSAADAAIEAARAEEIQLSADLRRKQNLKKQGVISQAELDTIVAGSTAASARLTAAIDQKKAAAAQVSLREAELKNAELQLSWTTMTAPADGRVSRKNVQPGQFVSPGQQLIALVGSGDLWVIANFKETQLEHMRPGQPVAIHVDAFPDREFSGKIESISAGTGAKFTLLPPDNASGNFVKVTQRVPVKILFTEKPDVPLAAGMNAVVEVKVK